MDMDWLFNTANGWLVIIWSAVILVLLLPLTIMIIDDIRSRSEANVSPFDDASKRKRQSVSESLAPVGPLDPSAVQIQQTTWPKSSTKHFPIIVQAASAPQQAAFPAPFDARLQTKLKIIQASLGETARRTGHRTQHAGMQAARVVSQRVSQVAAEQSANFRRDLETVRRVRTQYGAPAGKHRATTA